MLTLVQSWRVRLKALPLVQVFYFRQVPLIGEQKMVEIMEVLCKCLDDEVVEVREMAATTLSGILRLSPLSLESDHLCNKIQPIYSCFFRLLDMVHKIVFALFHNAYFFHSQRRTCRESYTRVRYSS